MLIAVPLAGSGHLPALCGTFLCELSHFLQETGERFVGCAADLTVIAVMAAGNDYLPGLHGTSLNANPSTPSLWELYVKLRGKPAWAQQCVHPFPKQHTHEVCFRSVMCAVCCGVQSPGEQTLEMGTPPQGR